MTNEEAFSLFQTKWWKEATCEEHVIVSLAIPQHVLPFPVLLMSWESVMKRYELDRTLPWPELRELLYCKLQYRQRKEMTSHETC